MLGDSSRGYLLELLLSKLRFASKCQQQQSPQGTKPPVNPLQIVGMSATIPNLSMIAQWLDAEFYITEYRPVPLYHKVVCGEKVFDLKEDFISGDDFPTPQLPSMDLENLNIKSEDAPLIYSAIETVASGHSALVFCPTKLTAENLCRIIAEQIFEFGSGKKFPTNARIGKIGADLKENIDREKINMLLEAFKQTVTDYDNDLRLSLRFGVAFHHAGLSVEERSLIEKGFRNGAIRILCSTTTLSAGMF